MRTAGAALGMSITQEKVLPTRFPEQGLLLIATDLAPISIPIRSGIVLLDLETDLLDSSGSLVGMIGTEREVILELARRMGALAKNTSAANPVLVTAASGGLGLTTLVALLGLVSVQRTQKTLLIEQTDQLLRILGPKGVSIDGSLSGMGRSKVGVLSSEVSGTPEFLRGAGTEFDSIIIGARGGSAPPINLAPSLHITTNTALAVERSSELLSKFEFAHILIRPMPYGSLSVKQVSALLGTSQITEWPADSNLALAADLGDLVKAKHAIERAGQIWSRIVGGLIDRRN